MSAESEPDVKRRKQLSILQFFTSNFNQKTKVHNETGSSRLHAGHSKTTFKSKKNISRKEPIQAFLKHKVSESIPISMDEDLCRTDEALHSASCPNPDSELTIDVTQTRPEILESSQKDMLEHTPLIEVKETQKTESPENKSSSDPGSPLLFMDSQPQVTDANSTEPNSQVSPIMKPALGMPFDQLKRMPRCCAPLPPLKSSKDHAVPFDATYCGDGPPTPRFLSYEDAWDPNHVRLPCSPRNLCPVKVPGTNKESLASRWQLIESSLLANISSSIDLEEAILSYNSRYADKWTFCSLHKFFTEDVDREFAAEFFSQTLPGVIGLALSLPKLCAEPIPLLRRQRNKKLTLTQQQIACLLSNAFLCTFPWRNSRKRDSEYANFPDINFNRLFMSGSVEDTVVPEKLKALVHYFQRVTRKMPNGTVTFERRCLDEFPTWSQSPCTLCGLHISSDGLIEKEGSGMLQVDFANRFLGGGVLGRGCVQEEIRFCISPELLVSRLLAEALDDNECVVITGVEQFSSYSGYGGTFKWEGEFIDETERDEWRRKKTCVVAMDALYFPKKPKQYSPDNVRRELNKAFCGFFCDYDPDHSPAVATGNWGCGAFRGDPILKGLIQLMSAATVGRDICYFTFNDVDLAEELHSMYRFIKEKKLQICDLWNLTVKYNKDVISSGAQSPRENLFLFLKRVYSAYDDSTDEDEVVDTRS